MLDLFEQMTGGRVYHMYNVPGGVRRDLPAGFLERVGQLLDYLDKRLPEYDDLFFANAVFIDRARGVGTLSQEQALAWGVTGPNLRAPAACPSMCAVTIPTWSMTSSTSTSPPRTPPSNSSAASDVYKRQDRSRRTPPGTLYMW